MALNPYEMRWEFLQNAQTRLEQELENKKERWYALKDTLDAEGKSIKEPFPSYPTSDEIHAVAEEMRIFVENAA